MLSLCIETTHNLKHSREETLEQLGKDAASFDLSFDMQYYVSSSQIHYKDGDNIKKELCLIRHSGKI